MVNFLLSNKRWLGAGFLLTFASGFGQTWFISLFAGFIQEKHGLSDGGWGALYTLSTLASAGLMLWRGAWADTVPLARLATLMAVTFAASALAFAFSPSVWILYLAVLGLRFCGQGMFSHIAMTAMGRWFAARRGQAVAIASLGYPSAEIVLPLLALWLVAAIGWQNAWVFSAILLVLPIAVGLNLLLRQSRTRQSALVEDDTTGLQDRHWHRREALRHWLFPSLVPVLLTPGFIGTVIFFHQVHVAEQKGWTLLAMTPGYTAYAVCSVLFSFISGFASDRFGPHRLLPFLLLPMGLGMALLGPAQDAWHWYVVLALIGVSQGISNAMSAVLFPFVYGTRHLGSLRSMAITIMVVSTAIGPGITGLLIDRGINFPDQALAMAAWCAAFTLVCTAISMKLNREIGAAKPYQS